MRLCGRFNKLPGGTLLLWRTLRRDQDKCFWGFWIFQVISCVSAKKGPFPVPMIQEMAWMGFGLLQIWTKYICFSCWRVSCIFLTLLFFPVSGLGQTRSICCRICQKQCFHNWCFLKCFSKVASQCPWRRKSALQLYNRYGTDTVRLLFFLIIYQTQTGDLLVLAP